MDIKSFFPPISENWVDCLRQNLKNKEGEFYLVKLEYTDGNHEMTDFYGIDVALSINDTIPVIICSFCPQEFFLTLSVSDKFFSLIGRKNVTFIQLPFSIEELIEKYDELLESNKVEDSLASEIERINSFNHKMSIIRHNSISFFQNNNSDYANSKIEEAIKQARELGLSGSDEQISEQIKNFVYKTNRSVFHGRYFKGVFCDIEGTLIIEGKLNVQLFNELQSLSKTKVITLWSGGNLDSIRKILAQNKIFWKLVSKYDFSEAEVEIAYDDEAFDLFARYNIKVRDYRCVK